MIDLEMIREGPTPIKKLFQMTLFASPEATAVLGTQTWLMSRIFQPSAYGCYLYSDRPLNDTGSQLLTYEEWLLDGRETIIGK